MDDRKLDNLIQENEIDKIIEYAKSLSGLNYNDFTDYLIKKLESTQIGTHRNTIAYILGELKCNNAIEALVKLIFSPELKNNRGSFVYALNNLECGNWLVELVPLLYEGNFEVRLNTYTLLENKNKSMSTEDKEKSIKLLDKKIEEYEHILGILYEVNNDFLKENSDTNCKNIFKKIFKKKN